MVFGKVSDMKSDNPVDIYLGRLAKSGRRSMSSQLKQIAKFMKWERHLNECLFYCLSFSDLESIKRHCIAEGKAARTINHLIQGLRAIAKIANHLDLISDKQLKPFLTISLLNTQPSERGKALDGNDVIKLISAMKTDNSSKGKRDLALLSVLLSSGLRRSEIVKLKVQDIDFESKSVIVVKGKGNKKRVQFLPDWSFEILIEWLNCKPDKSNFAFTSTHKTQIAKPLSTATIYQIVTHNTKNTLGFKCSPHDLRRTFVTELLNQNVDIATVSKMAGHANISTTQIYDKRGDEALIRAAKNLTFGSK